MKIHEPNTFIIKHRHHHGLNGIQMRSGGVFTDGDCPILTSIDSADIVSVPFSHYVIDIGLEILNASNLESRQEAILGIGNGTWAVAYRKVMDEIIPLMNSYSVPPVPPKDNIVDELISYYHVLRDSVSEEDKKRYYFPVIDNCN